MATRDPDALSGAAQRPHPGPGGWSSASFRSSLVPMVIADDDRYYVAVNAAACLLLRVPEEEVLTMRVDDLVAPAAKPAVEALWQDFIREGTQKGRIELAMPDGAVVAVDYSATANIQPGRHLSILMFPPGRADVPEVESVIPRPLLTSREREVLGMVAMGMGTAWIAIELGVAP